MTGALHDLQLQSSLPFPSSLAKIKLAKPGSPGKWSLKWRECVCVCEHINDCKVFYFFLLKYNTVQRMRYNTPRNQNCSLWDVNGKLSGVDVDANLLLKYYNQISPRLRNDLYCVEWDVKLYYIIPYHIIKYHPSITKDGKLNSMENSAEMHQHSQLMEISVKKLAISVFVCSKTVSVYSSIQS